MATFPTQTIEVALEPTVSLTAPMATTPMGIALSEELVTAIPIPLTTITQTATITRPTLIELVIPRFTDNLPDYGGFSEDSQIAYFTYPTESITFSYNMATQQLMSNELSRESDEEIVEQIKADLPSDARVVEVSPRYQNILYTTPISQPMRLERGAFSVPLGHQLWLYKENESIRLGSVDECFLISLSHIQWSSSETFATINAIAPMACAWSNWLIDLETFLVVPLDEIWADNESGFFVSAILPNRQLLLTSYLQSEPSAILDLQTKELTVFSNRGNELAKYFDDTVLLDLIFSSAIGRSKDETEIWLSALNENDRQLIGATEGLIRVKYVSPNQKHVLLFSGSPDYYGLSDDQESSGVWLLSFP